MYLAQSEKIKERSKMIRVLVWNEFQHEKTQEAVKKIYPDGMHTAIKEFLENQAKEGYKLVKVEGSNYWFEEIEPCEIKYAVEIFNKASNYNIKFCPCIVRFMLVIYNK